MLVRKTYRTSFSFLFFLSRSEHHRTSCKTGVQKKIYRTKTAIRRAVILVPERGRSVKNNPKLSSPKCSLLFGRHTATRIHHSYQHLFIRYKFDFSWNIFHRGQKYCTIFSWAFPYAHENTLIWVKTVNIIFFPTLFFYLLVTFISLREVVLNEHFTRQRYLYVHINVWSSELLTYKVYRRSPGTMLGYFVYVVNLHSEIRAMRQNKFYTSSAKQRTIIKNVDNIHFEILSLTIRAL